MMFLTPGGIKTLFPIYENSLVYKELAGKTQHLKRNKTKWTFIICPIFFKPVPTFWKGSFLNVCLLQHSGLRVRLVGNSHFCFLLEVANCLGVMALDCDGARTPVESSIGDLFGDKDCDGSSEVPCIFSSY